MSTKHPNDLRYTSEHEWARLDDGGLITIGITAFAVESLGDITQVDLPPEGEVLAKGAVFGTVESVKAVSDLFAPMAGKVVKVNDPLKNAPEMVNDDCYDEGWMIQIEPTTPGDLDELMSAEKYEEYLKENG